MQDIPHTLWEHEEINLHLHKPINSTLRIKYTCFNVSPSYIILGSTSGSIYLFSRESCLFQQLIPLSEGAVTHVAMSPDEKTIALATARGTICLVSIKPNVSLIATSIEHMNEQINCICWNNNSYEVYIGDGTGKVSVLVHSIFTVNGMFQAPACMLMNLDSSIVQLNYCSPLLLVSTLTRCYICDTLQEQYKQIGNKARNGEFGACFFKIHTLEDNKSLNIDREDKLANAKSSFSFITEIDNNVIGENYPEIFCARPGSRLWEVSANGVVIKTHQFKEALAVSPICIYKSHIPSIELHSKQIYQPWPAQSINFSRLFLIAQKYLFSYTTNGLYILDPTTASVVLWTNEFTNIAMVDVIGNNIYLMTCDNEFHCLTLCSIDSLILHLYNNKQYYECVRVCILYKLQLLKSTISKEIIEICDIESKLETLENIELSTKLLPLVTLLGSSLSTHPVKLDSGIVVVHTGHLSSKNEKCYSFRSMTKANNLLGITQEAKCSNNSPISMVDCGELNKPGSSNVINVDENFDDTKALDFKADINIRSENKCEEFASDENVTHKVQAELEPIYESINKIKASMSEEELQEVITNIQVKLNNIKDSYKSLDELKDFMYEVIRTAELYYFNTLMENTSVELLNINNNEYIMKQYIKAFIDVNIHNYPQCVCNAPCPTSSLKEPKFLEIGRTLLLKFLNDDTSKCVYLCNRIPFMWREYLSIYIDQQHSIHDILRQCLQLRDNIVHSILLPRLDSKLWRSVMIFLKDLEDGKCLFCGHLVGINIENNFIDWNGISCEIMKKDGPDAAMTFLIKLNSIIPNLSFDMSVFQSLIFTKILHHHDVKCTIDFNKNSAEANQYNAMCSVKVQDQLKLALEKDLGRPLNKNIFGTGAHHWGMRYQPKSLICPCCTLSLQTPVLLGDNGIAIFSCGHAYHVNCMRERKLTKCNLHS